MKKRNSVLACAAVILCFLLLFCLANRLLQPKYATDLVEGGMLRSYYKEAGSHDVIFIGDCEVYANFSPLEMYSHSGITAYVRGSSQQLIWQSYYILAETLRYETPKVVVYNVNAMRYSEPVSEAYNRLTIDGMRWSSEKVGIIRASMMEEESFLSYVFPVLRYHSRFDELTGEDLIWLLQNKDNTFNGFLMNQGVKPAGTLPAKRPLADYAFGDICWEYLDRMRLLCEEKGVSLVLIKAPSLYPYWYEEYDRQIADYAQTHGLRYYNLLPDAEAIGIDYQTDTYDGGLHLNLAGATKLSRFFADRLQEDFSLRDWREDPVISQIYQQKLEEYSRQIQ